MAIEERITRIPSANPINKPEENGKTNAPPLAESGRTQSSLASVSRLSASDVLTNVFDEDGQSSRRSSEIDRRLSGRSTFDDHVNIKNLTINKLRYETGLFGREKEIDVLRSRLVDVASETRKGSNKELVFIKGYSGVGKSTLACTLEQLVSEMENGVYGKGKFGLNTRDEPFAGIASSFRDIFRRIKIGYSDRQDRLTSEICQAALTDSGAEVEVLMQLIPELGEMLPQATWQGSHSNLSDNSGAREQQWKYAFRVLARVLGSLFSPTVFFFDDLQWADLASLKLIDSFLSDSQSLNALVIVGCFRSNEVSQSHSLSTFISDLEQRQEKEGFGLTSIELGGLEIVEVNRVIMAMLAIDEEARTMGLAEICFKRTLGNPFFVMQFMTLLVEWDLVSFSLGLLEWQWDVEEIEKETMSADNVVDLLQCRMRNLPKDDQLLLEYAACLGSSFQISVLELVWSKHSVWKHHAASTEIGMEDQKILTSLKALEQGYFLEKTGVDSYRWVHDKVQEAALSLRDEGIEDFQFEVGSVLYQSMKEEELEKLLFDVVDLINKGRKQNRPEFSALNLRAAERAFSISAFQRASAYASNGIKQLPSNKWTEHRHLTLQLFTIGADIELALGRVEEMEGYTEEVLSRSNYSTLEKLPLYMTKFRKLCGVDRKYNETIVSCVAILKKLGFSMVWNSYTLPYKAKFAFIRTVRRAMKVPKGFYESPIKMTDPRHQAIMNVLARIKIAAFQSSDKFLVVLSTTRMIEMTMVLGVHPSSGDAYSSLAVLTVATSGNLEAASHFAETSLIIQNAVSSRYTETKTLFTLNFGVFPWIHPIPTCLKQLYRGYMLGMQSGNTEIAMWNLLMQSIVFPYVMGKALSFIEDIAPHSIAQMEELKQSEQALYARMWYQAVLNLVGKSRETVVLNGSEFEVETLKTLEYPNPNLSFAMISCELLVFFGDFESAAEAALSRGNMFAETFPGLITSMMESFHRGLALYVMARKTKKRKYKKAANKVRKMIRTWIQRGNPNVKHHYMLLSAEHAALTKDFEQATSLYQKAIVLAGRSGHLHHTALFNERYADFLMEELGDEEEALYRIEEATRYYKEWGAMRKVGLLLEKTIAC
eukprot:scaffold11662_cov117-Cylindrotheca_fusiformis.AAC.2